MGERSAGVAGGMLRLSRGEYVEQFELFLQSAMHQSMRSN
jgi:hypothetical protein